MTSYEKYIKTKDLMIEVWWEPGENAFQATVRDDKNDDGWTASAAGVPDAIEAAVRVYRRDVGA